MVLAMPSFLSSENTLPLARYLLPHDILDRQNFRVFCSIPLNEVEAPSRGAVLNPLGVAIMLLNFTPEWADTPTDANKQRRKGLANCPRDHIPFLSLLDSGAHCALDQDSGKTPADEKRDGATRKAGCQRRTPGICPSQ